MFVEIVRLSGAVPVLMTQANRITDSPDPVVRRMLKRVEDVGIGYAEYKWLYDRFTDITQEVGEEREVMVIDLAREVPQSARYMYDAMHYNDVGSDLAATIVADRLLEELGRR